VGLSRVGIRRNWERSKVLICQRVGSGNPVSSVVVSDLGFRSGMSAGKGNID
jgi:hypothetical protein